MDNFWHHSSHVLHLPIWLVKITITLALGLFFSWLENWIYHRLVPRLEKTHKAWDDTLLKALRLPLQLLIWVLVITIVIPVLLYQTGIATDWMQYFNKARQVIFIFAMLWFLLRYIKMTEVQYLAKRSTSDKQQTPASIRAISQFVRVAIAGIASLAIFQTLGFKITAFLTFGSIGAVAASFAAKDTLANFFGGLMVFWDRPFTIGDWIRSPDRNIEGTVEHIGWRLTRIRTFDKRPLYVPNGIFSTISVENPSRMFNRRIYATIGLRYQDAPKMALILEDIEKMLREHPEIDTSQTLMVNLIEFGASSLNFMVYTFTKTTNWIKFQAVQQDVFLRIIEIITAHDAECAFPSTTVNVPEGLVVHQSRQ